MEFNFLNMWSLHGHHVDFEEALQRHPSMVCEKGYEHEEMKLAVKCHCKVYHFR